MSDITTVGLDLAKNIFQIHAVDAQGYVIEKRSLRRSQLIAYFKKLPPCLVGMEAVGVLIIGDVFYRCSDMKSV